MGWFSYAQLGAYPWLEFVVLRFLDALFTGLMLVAVIAVVVRVLKVRGVTFKYEMENGSPTTSTSWR